MNFNEVISNLPKMQIMKSLLEENWMTASNLQEQLNVGRGELVDLCSSLQEADYISKSKRLIGGELLSCYAVTPKGLREYQEYQLKIEDHIDKDTELILANKKLELNEQNEESIEQFLSN